MMAPIRCPTCGKPIGHLCVEYTKRVKNGENPEKVLDDLGLDRYCCRTAVMTYVDLIDTIGKFKKVTP